MTQQDNFGSRWSRRAVLGAALGAPFALSARADDYPVASAAHGRALRRRRPDRRPHAHRRRAGWPAPPSADRGREPRRRRRQHRRRIRRAQHTRRIHDARRRPGDPRHQQGAVQEDRLRPGDRLRLRGYARRHRQCAAGQSASGARQLGRRTDRARQEEAGRNLLRLERPGLAHAPDLRDHGASGRHRPPARALSGRVGADDRPARRPHRHDLHRRLGGLAAGEIRPAARASP